MEVIVIVTVSNSAPTAPDITPTTGTISNTFQVISVSLTGAPTVGDKYNVIINGNIITETAVGGDTAFSIADRLDNKIALNGAIGSAVASGWCCSNNFNYSKYSRKCFHN